MFFNLKKVFLIFVLVVIIISSAILSSRVFSYNDTITHPSLTENIAKIYNKSSELKLTNQEINWLKQGSIEEDIPPRWMNHFYNPNTSQGLWGFASSKVWAQSPNLQTVFVPLSKGDQTWQKAINSYIKGDKKSAFIALGHVLHLIEDTTVPAHTRLDAHLTGDPYEEWVKKSIGYQINFDVELTSTNQLSDAFDIIAFYSNNYFLSKDTIDKKLLAGKDRFIKKINQYEAVECVEGNDGKTQFCLIVIRELPSGIEYRLDENVHSDYYSLLAPKAVSYGAGVMKLFFEEAKKRKAELEVQKKAEEQKSWWQKLIDGVKSINIFSDVLTPVIQESKVSPTPTGSVYSPTPSFAPVPLTAQGPVKVSLPQDKIIIAKETIAESSGSITEQTLSQDKEAPSPITEEKSPDEAILPSPSPVSSPSPSPIATTTLAYSGGSGGLTQEEQETTEQTSTSTGAVAPEISISLVGYSLTARSFSVVWQSSSSNVLFSVQQKQNFGDWQEWMSATTSTSTIFIVPQDLTTYYFRVQAIDTNNATSSWQEISAPINFYPVVINEIAWAGTGTSTSASYDEWLELYNKTNSSIDLSAWKITKGGASTTIVVTLQGQIAPSSYYLIEHTDDAISGIVVDMSGSWGGGRLLNSGEHLRLIDLQDNLIDDVDGSDNWRLAGAVVGTAVPDYLTAERVNPFLAADVPGNWQSNSTSTRNGLNYLGQPINGTPKAQNSVFDLNFFYLYPAQNTTATSTILEWTPSYISNFKEYKIVRSFDAGFNAASTTIVAATTTTGFFDESLESETTYYYKISACDLSDCVSSNVASTTTSEFPFFWAEPQVISEVSTSTEVALPDIVLASDDMPVIVWQSSTSTQARNIKFSKKNIDDTWSQPIDISQNPAGYEMQILSKGNRLEVLYSSWWLEQGKPPFFDVFSVRSENGLWQPAQNISQEGTNNSWAAGTIDSAMTTYIVWQGLSQSSSSPPYSKAIFYRALDSSGLFLGTSEEIPGSVNGFSPNIIIDSQNKLWAFWSGCAASYCDEIFYSVNNQDGSGWSGGQMIFDGKFESTISGRPQILLDENNQFLLAWQQRSYEILVSEFDGVASTTQKAIFSKTSKQADTPSLIRSNAGKIYVFWSYHSDIDGGIYFSWQKQNGQWQEIKTALEKPQPIMWARAVIDSNNIAHLVWGNDHLEIYYTFGKIE